MAKTDPLNTDINEILPSLFLGNLVAAESHAIIDEHAITHVLSLTSTKPKIPASASVAHKHFPIHDSTGQNLLSVLNGCIAIIEEVLASGGRILVHCYLGKSRSGGVVVAYVMKHLEMSLKAAHEFVKERRPIVHPNRAFRSQLELWGSCGYSDDILAGEEVLDFGFGDSKAVEGSTRSSTRSGKVGKAGGQWAVVRMDSSMRIRFEQCLTDVGIVVRS